MTKLHVIFIAMAAFLFPSIAHADPCEGPLPQQAGIEFHGTVRYVIDGDGWCVGQNDNPSTWIEVRASDFDAAELATPEGRQGKTIAERILFGRPITCRSTTGRNGRSVTNHDRVFASCSINGQRAADLLRRAGVPEGGN